MKRFFDDEGQLTYDPALIPIEKLVSKAFKRWIDAGYCHKDFMQFLQVEASIHMYDFEIDRALNIIKEER